MQRFFPAKERVACSGKCDEDSQRKFPKKFILCRYLDLSRCNFCLTQALSYIPSQRYLGCVQFLLRIPRTSEPNTSLFLRSPSLPPLGTISQDSLTPTPSSPSSQSSYSLALLPSTFSLISPIHQLDFTSSLTLLKLQHVLFSQSRR